MKRSVVEEDDILKAARQLHGLERMDQKYAVLEKSGEISIIQADDKQDTNRLHRGPSLTAFLHQLLLPGFHWLIQQFTSTMAIL